MPVDASRHYRGPGLGEVGMWACPSCGAENAGPLAQGCLVCGAGSPGRRVEPSAQAPPPPPAALGEGAAPLGDSETDNVWTRWRDAHPDGTREDAFTAGYIEGMREAQRLQAVTAEQRQPQRDESLAPEGKLQRTIVAALALFRDQVLVHEPDEVDTGEWLSAAEVTQFIQNLSQQVTHG